MRVTSKVLSNFGEAEATKVFDCMPLRIMVFTPGPDIFVWSEFFFAAWAAFPFVERDCTEVFVMLTLFCHSRDSLMSLALWLINRIGALCIRAMIGTLMRRK
jgi:hypothetical protein